MATTLSRKIGNQTMTFESGKLARQAEGSVVVTYGETQVLAGLISDDLAGDEELRDDDGEELDRPN